MNIIKIKKLKNNKYKIITDSEEIVTYDNVVLENEILYKKSIDKDLYKKIIIDTEYYDAYNSVVKYILKKLRTEKEIRIYLSKYELKNSDINRIIDKLRSINLINDKEYVKSYISDKIHLNKQGINRIREDLVKQNIDTSIIEEELSKIDYSVLDENLEKIIINKIKHNKKHSNNELRIKITNEMVLKGYSRERITSILENNIIDDTNIINSEYNKIYNKLCKKYSGNELLMRLKQKLYSRGFTSEQINNLLDKKTEDFN